MDAQGKIFAGIDPSIRSTGIVSLVDGELNTELIKRGKGDTEIGTMIALLNQLEWTGQEIVDDGLPSYVCIEEPMGLRGHAQINVAAYWSVIQGLGAESDPDFFAPIWLLRAAPTQVKKFVTDNGKAKTSEVTAAIAKRWPDEFAAIPGQEDLIMALAMMKMAQCTVDVQAEATDQWPKFQVKLIEGMISKGRYTEL